MRPYLEVISMEAVVIEFGLLIERISARLYSIKDDFGGQIFQIFNSVV